MEFENLFEGNRLLAGPIRDLIRENSLELFLDVNEEVNKAYSEVGQKYAAAFFDNIPIDEVFMP